MGEGVGRPRLQSDDLGQTHPSPPLRSMQREHTNDASHTLIRHRFASVDMMKPNGDHMDSLAYPLGLNEVHFDQNL